MLRNPDYAGTLERLAARGPDDFYTGELASEIGRDLAANGSFVTAQDLADYAMRDIRPLTGTYRGYSFAPRRRPTAARHCSPSSTSSKATTWRR